MKASFKYILLLIFAFVISFLIYVYIEASKPVSIEDDVLLRQSEIDTSIFNDTNYSIENPKVILNPYGNSPLTALVIFETKDLTSPTVTVVGKNDVSTISNTFVPSKKHVLPIYGLYPDYDNEVIIEVSGKEKKLSIKTEKILKDLAGVENKNIEADSNELYFVSTDNYPCAFDSNGDLRWYLTTKYTWDILRLNNGHLLMGNNKLIKAPYYSIGLVEFDLLGNIYYEYNVNGGYHHSVYEMENGNLLLVSNNNETNTVEDYVIEIDRSSGLISKKFNFEKILDNLDSGNWLGIDSVWFDKKTNSVTISGSKNNTIVNVDYPSGEINYIIGNAPKKFKKYQIDEKLEKPLSVSNENGSLLYYSDNKITNSTIQNNKLENKFSYNVGVVGNLSVSKTSDAYLFSADNYIKEILDNKSENKIEFNQKIGNVIKAPLYANDVFIASKGTRLGKMGPTETIKNQSVLFYKNGKDIMKKYDIKIYKEPLRLIVSGKFNDNDDVEIILDNILDKKTYKMDTIDGTSYKYINEDNIKGKYYIYIKLNGKFYKTYKCVTLY